MVIPLASSTSINASPMWCNLLSTIHPVNNAIFEPLSFLTCSIKLGPSALIDLPVFSIFSLNAICSGSGPLPSLHAISLKRSIASPKVFISLGQTALHFPQLVHLYNPSFKLSSSLSNSSLGSDSNLERYLIM